MIGQTLGHYRIVEKIGAGGMGSLISTSEPLNHRKGGANENA